VNAIVLRYHGEKDREPLHIPECGLKDVYLLSGYAWHDTQHGRGLAKKDVDGLHRAIGRHLANQRRRLAGKEWLFLRIGMDVSQMELGRLLHISDQQVARWEKEICEISGPAQVLFRCLYLQHLGDTVDLRTFSEQLEEGPGRGDGRTPVTNGKEGWRLVQ
jgi:putative transcriptional regulator